VRESTSTTVGPGKSLTHGRSRVARGLGYLVAAELFEQSFARHDAIGAHQQDGEQRPLSRSADRQRPAVRSCLERPEDEEFHRSASISESHAGRL
jgi:hypothetical protein